MNIKKFLIIFILMSIAAYIVYAAAPNPGHPASEVGGDEMDETTFMNLKYTFPNKLAVGKAQPEYAFLDVKGTGDTAIVGHSDGYPGVFGKSDTTAGVMAEGLSFGVWSRSGDDGCDVMAAGSAKYCFDGGSYLTIVAGSNCGAGEVQVASSNGKVLCFKG